MNSTSDAVTPAQVVHKTAMSILLAISFSQGARWKALINRYIGTIPVNHDESCAAAHSMSGMPAPWSRRLMKQRTRGLSDCPTELTSVSSGG